MDVEGDLITAQRDTVDQRTVPITAANERDHVAIFVEDWRAAASPEVFIARMFDREPEHVKVIVWPNVIHREAHPEFRAPEFYVGDEKRMVFEAELRVPGKSILGTGYRVSYRAGGPDRAITALRHRSGMKVDLL